MRVLLGVVISAFSFACVPSHAQTLPPVDPCPVAHESGVKSYAGAYVQFSAELRHAIATKNATELSFLVEFPLIVNTMKGTIRIQDATSLQGHMQMIFPEATRAKILASGPNDAICKGDGYGLAYGTLWLSATKGRWWISRVNLTELVSNEKTPSVIYACETKTHRIVVSETSSKTLRYRSWNKPRAVSDRPDLELANGGQSYGGSGICTSTTYTFKQGNVTIDVFGGLGCTDGSEPEKATGKLAITIAGKLVTDTYCF